MSKNKNKPLKERVAIREATQSQAKEKQRLKEESNRLRQQNANKPGYDKDGNKLDEKEKLKINQREDVLRGIDLEKLREEGTPGIDPLYSTTMSPKMKESYERNQGNPEFNREMDAYRKAKDKGNLSDEDRIRILNRNKGLLQISQIAQKGRQALAIGNGLWQFTKALSQLNRGY